MMTQEDCAALREAASKATPGPWEIGNTSDDIRMVLGQDDYICCVQIYQTPRHMGQWQEPQRISNARYIAAAHPTAVLALLDAADERDRLREALIALLDDSEPVDFGEWLEARMKQARAALEATP